MNCKKKLNLEIANWKISTPISEWHKNENHINPQILLISHAVLVTF